MTTTPSTEPRKPLLVGEVNPWGTDPEMALYPLPEEASGGRLARILGLSRGEYLRRFDRVNLCTGVWTNSAATRASYPLRIADGRPKILLGRKVALAFGYTTGSHFGRDGNFYFLPHPSGRNRIWNRPSAHEKARELLKEFLPRLPGCKFEGTITDLRVPEHVTDGSECWCGPEKTPDGLVVHRRLQ